MANKIDGIDFKNMVEYAVRNLNNHVKLVNQLNVFPVPDGDTGTNMVTTIHKGLQAVGETIVDLPSVSRKFARSVVFEARGNSGVIVSQFLKGIAEKFYDVDAADGAMFIEALERGVTYAYSAVATPVEGTMLTVMKDATKAVKAEFDGSQSIKAIVDSFVAHAKRSLENTPELLAVLKESGVVDSGGAGVVYLFEGMQKYLDNQPLEAVEQRAEGATVDYDAFHRDSRFEYGYCTELLLQLLNGREAFLAESFKEALAALGDSLVVSVEGDKVRVHVHTQYPERVFELCHRYGEFLSLKVENMTVQHTGQVSRILCSSVKNEGAFGVVAVAYDPAIQQLFLDMGADVVICAEENVSTKDYLDAFACCEAEHIFVFPNSSDAILSATQAKKMVEKTKVTVLNSRTVAECYAALPAIDFEQTDVEAAADAISGIIHNLYVISIAKRSNSLRYAGKEISRNEYYSFSGKELLHISKNLTDVAVQTICDVTERQGREIVTVFYSPLISDQEMEVMVAAVEQKAPGIEVFTVATDSLPCLMTVSFE